MLGGSGVTVWRCRAFWFLLLVVLVLMSKVVHDYLVGEILDEESEGDNAGDGHN